MNQESIRAAFYQQAEACRKLGSPFTARLLRLIAEHLDDELEVGKAILNWPGNPIADALALRVAGALHSLVLTERSADLKSAYPPDAIGDDEHLWLAVDQSLKVYGGEICSFIESPPQTNEVARSAVLAGGFLTLAKLTALPLSLLEIGASASLNLHWDRYGYDLGGLGLNKASGKPLLSPTWTGPPPPDANVVVAERAGCDRAPIDRLNNEALLRLRAYVWPDQPDRLQRLDEALAVTRGSTVSIDPTNAGDWVTARLAERRLGVTTVIFHSIVWQYIEKQEQIRIKDTIEKAGRFARTANPLAWLQMEPETRKAAALRLTVWPDGRNIHLADVDYHGRWVHWLREPDRLT